ncbi:hypothetical protein IFM89_029917 [Coptis chinensis]|uniref:Bulb-type lectin domain-containing protein n=1 Tax=Coptis chinensis TaxID=261450 RepID=A0A835HI06_9MAGN|nr:hypothetical protein IFM89_029917 [Coptis chinensis]
MAMAVLTVVMKNYSTTFLPIILFSLMVLLSPVIANSSPFNITIGSSLSTSSAENSYWLSPNGTFAFGFYQLPSTASADQYIVGIWIPKSSSKTLVWVANRDDPPFSAPSSILFTQYGNLVQVSGTKEIPLLSSVQSPASYAMFLDNGNLVLYNSYSHIVWESFDFPTDTILPGQTLKSGFSVVAKNSPSDYSTGRYSLKGEKLGAVKVYDDKDFHHHRLVRMEMKLNSDGRLYLVGWNGLTVTNLTKGEEHNETMAGNRVVYRATMDYDGAFSLYEEKLGFQMENSGCGTTSDCPEKCSLA